MASPEQLPDSGEKGIETSEAAGEQLEKLLSNPETASELGKENFEKQAETAKTEAVEKAISVEKNSTEKAKKPSSAAPKRHGVVSKKEQEKSFKRHIEHVQSELSPSSRVFSKIIHNKAIEKTSDFVGATVARPDAILSGAVVAFFLVLGVYLIAKSLGYVLSGFETIGAFIIGWILGVVYDYVRALVTGKQ